MSSSSSAEAAVALAPRVLVADDQPGVLESRVGWSANGAELEVVVSDDGPGLSNTQNLFVPFSTTKPGGTGIGLVLCRQIAEAHGGTLKLENRQESSGCEARLRLPQAVSMAIGSP